MAGYTRNDVSNNIANGNVVNAADLDGEFDALVAAFHAATGHVHDGSAANGAPVTVLGPVQDIVASASELRPKTDSAYELGTTALRWSTAYIDDMVLTNALPVLQGGTGSTTAGGARTNLGLGTISTQDNTSVNIDGGSIDGTTIGGTTAAAGSFTTLDATGLVKVTQGGGSFSSSPTSRTAYEGIDGTTPPILGVIDSVPSAVSWTASNQTEFMVSRAGDTAVTIVSNPANTGQINFGDNADEDVGNINYSHSNNAMNFVTNATAALTLNSSQLATFTGKIKSNGAALMNSRPTYGGTANAITLTTGTSMSSLVTGMRLWFRATSGNTGATTINVDGIGAVSCITVTGDALPSGYIRTDVDTEITYNGTNWVVDRMVEYGSNANGHYTRHADGTLRTWRSDSYSITSMTWDVETDLGTDVGQVNTAASFTGDGPMTVQMSCFAYRNGQSTYHFMEMYQRARWSLATQRNPDTYINAGVGARLASLGDNNTVILCYIDFTGHGTWY